MPFFGTWKPVELQRQRKCAIGIFLKILVINEWGQSKLVLKLFNYNVKAVQLPPWKTRLQTKSIRWFHIRFVPMKIPKSFKLSVSCSKLWRMLILILLPIFVKNLLKWDWELSQSLPSTKVLIRTSFLNKVNQDCNQEP